jgi:hypothetical protein
MRFIEKPCYSTKNRPDPLPDAPSQRFSQTKVRHLPALEMTLPIHFGRNAAPDAGFQKKSRAGLHQIWS